MRIAVVGNPGSGKTKTLKEIALRENLKYYSAQKFREEFFEKYVLSNIERDFVLFLLYKKNWEKTYKTFDEFLLDVRELFNYILNSPFWLEDIITSNEVFKEFVEMYEEAMKILNKNKIYDLYTFLKYQKISLEGVCVDNIDALYLKEIEKIISSKRWAVSFSDETLKRHLPKDAKIINLASKKHTSEVKHLQVENILEFIQEKTNSSSNAFIISKKLRHIIWKYVPTNTNKEIEKLMQYAFKKKFFNSITATPQLWKNLSNLASLLGYDETAIIEFLENYEEIFYETIKHIYVHPIQLEEKKYETIFFDKNYKATNTIKAYKSKIFPYDFFSSNALFYEFEDKHHLIEYLKSKARKVIILDYAPPKKIFDVNQELALPIRENTYISFSQISLYQLCPYRYKLRYIHNLKEDIKTYFEFGSLIHYMLEIYLKENKKLEEILEMFKNHIIKLTHIFKDKTPKYYEEGKRILHEVITKDKEIFSSYENIGIEEELTLEVNNKILIGKADRILRDKKGNIYLLDYKTSFPRENTIKSAKNQLALYSKILKEKNLNIRGAFVWFLIPNEIIPLSITSEEMEEQYKKVIETVKNIEEGRFPAKPSKNACGSCSFKLLCRYWRYV